MKARRTDDASPSIGIDGELLLDLVLPFLDTQTLASCICVNRRMSQRVRDQGDDLWEHVLHRDFREEIDAEVTERVRSRLGSSSKSVCLALAAVRRATGEHSFDEIRDSPPASVLQVSPDGDVRQSCLAAVDWLLSSDKSRARQLLWRSRASQLLCTRHDLSKAENEEGASAFDMQFTVTGESCRSLRSSEQTIQVIQECVYSDCWGVEIRHSDEEAQALYSCVCYDSLTDTDEHADACRENLITPEAGDLLRLAMLQGCQILLHMYTGGDPSSGVVYSYECQRGETDCWRETAVYAYRTNIHGLLSVLWDESQDKHPHELDCAVSPTQWEGWRWHSNNNKSQLRIQAA